MVNLFHSWNLNLDEKKNSGFKPEDKEGKKADFDSRKTRIPSFATIDDAYSKATYGQIFTTPKSSNIYVITHGTWGEKSKDKVVKSFPAGTPYSEIKGYSERTKSKHGGKTVKSGEKGREEAGFATKDNKDDVKNMKPVN
tara:strand:+ start:126 stop:545 length:420 start_codon:yes stop_codon:yes gene_type:complete